MSDIQLPAVRYRIDVELEDNLTLDFYAGSMLRGAFGWELRRQSCLTGLKHCPACPLFRSCPYAYLYETPAPLNHPVQKFSQVPHPYVIEPPAPGRKRYLSGSTFHFHMVLIGRANDYSDLVRAAWNEVWNAGKVMDGVRGRLVSMNAVRAPNQKVVDGNQVSLQIRTPMRLQRNGKPLRPGEINARTLLIALARRIQLLGDFHAQNPPALDFPKLAGAAEHIEMDTDLRWVDWRRWSNRQCKKMPLGGVSGSISLRGELGDFGSILDAGQWTHIGKNATFGLGQYEVVH